MCQQYYVYLIDDKYNWYCTYYATLTKPIISTHSPSNKSKTNMQYDCAIQITDEEFLNYQISYMIMMINQQWYINTLQSFEHLCKTMMDIITEQMHKNKNKSHPFTVVWIKAMHFGLWQLSTWDKVSTQLSIKRINDCIGYVKWYPNIHDQYQFDHNIDTTFIQYCNTQLSVLDQMNTSIKQLSSLY
jgi:hypothetical protein